MRPSSANIRSEADAVTGPTLRCLRLQLRRPTGSLLDGIEAALAVHGQPLRWAITGVTGDSLAIEAVVICGEEA
jgi:hypothetical protein